MKRFLKVVCNPTRLTVFPRIRSGYMAESTWSYSNQEEWRKIPGCHAGGKCQSPINISFPITERKASLKPIQLSSDWYKPLSGMLLNTGTSLRFEPSAGSSPLRVETSFGAYNLAQFHFHWGPCPGRGSEHTVNNTSQDAELHFVLTNSDVSKTDLTVLGVLLKGNATLPLAGVWEPLATPPKYDQTVQISDYPIAKLFPGRLDYWHYCGSLTTPPCSEIVTWYVFQEVVILPTKVLEGWRKMEGDVKGTPLTSNYRAVQLLNKRKIFTFAV